MIPDSIAEFISQPGLPMSFGTRDAELQTTVSHAWAIRLNEDKTQIRFVFPKKAMAERHEGNLQQNGRLAFTIGHPVSHECYQMKGKCNSFGDSTAEDLQLLENNLEAFMGELKAMYGDQVPDIFSRLKNTTYVSVAFTPEEIFNQSPGPGAGKKII